jgi:hypothetical protein
MCPVCITTAALLAGSAISTGGLTALVVEVYEKNFADKTPPPDKPKETEHGH